MIFFYYDVGIKFGSGHAKRCLVINEKIKKKGIKTFYLSLDNKQIINKNFGKNIIYNKDLKSNLNNNRSILIIDSYKITQSQINSLKKYFKFIFLINDIPIKNIDIYGIINPNYGIKKEHYNNKIKKKFLGINYKLIFEKKIKPNKKKTGITISFGTGNVYKRVNKFLFIILNFLDSLKYLEKITILMNLKTYQKKKILSYKNLKIKVYNTSNNFIHHAQNSKYVVSSMGIQYDELIKLNIPAIFIKIAENQDFNYRMSYKINPDTTNNLNNLNEEKIVYALKNITKKKNRNKIIKNYKKYLLGKKTNHLVNYLVKLIKS